MQAPRLITTALALSLGAFGNTTGPHTDSGSAYTPALSGVGEPGAVCSGFNAFANVDQLAELEEPETGTAIDWHCMQECLIDADTIPGGAVPVGTLMYATNARRDPGASGTEPGSPSTGAIHVGAIALSQSHVYSTPPEGEEADYWSLDAQTTVSSASGVRHLSLPLGGALTEVYVAPPLFKSDLTAVAEPDTGAETSDTTYRDDTDADTRSAICQTLDSSDSGEPWGYLHLDIRDNDGGQYGDALSSDPTVAQVDCDEPGSGVSTFLALPLKGARRLNPNGGDGGRLRLTLLPHADRIDYAGRRLTSITWTAGDVTDLVVAHKGRLYPLEGSSGTWTPPEDQEIYVSGNFAFYGVSPDEPGEPARLEITGDCEQVPGHQLSQVEPTRFALTPSHLEALGLPPGLLHEEAEVNVRVEEGTGRVPDVIRFELPWLETRGIVLDEDGTFSTEAFERGLDLDLSGRVLSVQEDTLSLEINGVALILLPRVAS